MGAVIVLHLYPDKQKLDQEELDRFNAWLKTLDVDPLMVRAATIEAPAVDGPDTHYLLHLAEFVTRGEERFALDPATNEPAFAYRTIRLDDWTWPDVRAA